MSTASDAQYKHFIQYCVQWSSIALLYYDYALTFSREYEFVWRRRLGPTTVLYVLCRYALAGNVLYLLAISGYLHNCDSAYQAIAAISILGRAAVLITWTARTWAVWQRNPYILAFLGSIVVTVVALDCYETSGVQCVGRSFNQGANDALVLLVVAFEFLSTCLTLYRCIPAIREQRRGGIIQASNSVFMVLAQEGLVYYSFVSLFTMSAVIINFRAPENHPIRRLPSAFTLPFSGMLTARFILHLRARVGEDVVKTDAGRTSMTVSRLAFGPPADADSSQGATESTFVSTWEAPMDVENRALVFALSPLSSGTASTSGQTTTFVSERPPRRDHGQKGKGRAR